MAKRRGMICQKKLPVKITKACGSVRTLLNRACGEYMDERGKELVHIANQPGDQGYKKRAKPLPTLGTDSEYDTVNYELHREVVTKPKRIISNDYYSRGRLHVGGYMKTVLAENLMPMQAPKDRRGGVKWMNKVSQIYAKKKGLSRNPRAKTVGHRFMLSPQAGDIDQLTANGISAYPLMEESLRATIADIEKRLGLNTGDMGYIYSWHLDTNNLHMHVLIFANDKNGKKVPITNIDKIIKEEWGSLKINNKEISGFSRVAMKQWEQTMDRHTEPRIQNVPDRRNRLVGLLRSQNILDNLKEYEIDAKQLFREIYRGYVAFKKISHNYAKGEEQRYWKWFRSYTGVDLRTGGNFSELAKVKLSRLILGQRSFIKKKVQEPIVEKGFLPTELEKTYDDFRKRVAKGEIQDSYSKEKKQQIKMQENSLRDQEIEIPQTNGSNSGDKVQFLQFMDKLLTEGSSLIFDSICLQKLEVQAIEKKNKKGDWKAMMNQQIGKRLPNAVATRKTPGEEKILAQSVFDVMN